MAIRTVHVGLGPIGCSIVRQTAARKGLKIVGAADVDPVKIGRDLGEVAELKRRLRVPVTADLAATLAATKPDIAVLCTGSSLRRVLPQIETILQAGVAIVSTTEELSYPVGANKKLARRIDELAKAAGVAVLGTGVNPGFLMDALPIKLTGVCERVETIEVERVQDARQRRLPFQQKIGSALSPAEFQRQADAGKVRHVGLRESVSMIAGAMGWKLERITDEIAPKIATKKVSSEFLTVAPGEVCGLVQEGIGYRDGKPVIRLHMEAYLGAPKSYEAIRIHGSPNIALRIDGGVQGDVATASIVVNSIPKVLSAAPGLRTMLDLPLASYFGG